LVVRIVCHELLQLRKINMSYEKRRRAEECEALILAGADRQEAYNEFQPLHWEDEERGELLEPETHSLSESAAVNPGVLDWSYALIDSIKHRLSFLSTDSQAAGATRLQGAETIVEVEEALRAPLSHRFMHHLVSSLDAIVSTPFIYLAKGSDPIAVLQAIEYINSNELSCNIIVLHFVDDRKSARIQEHVMDKLGESVNKGVVTACEFNQFDVNLVKKSYCKDEESPNFVISLDPRELHFKVSEALPTLSRSAQQLVKNVALLDTFYA
jgi:hypothetical protein